MDAREALLQAIRASPGHDGPRLVYADFLTEQGDPRGEFIVAQCTGQEAQERASWTEHGARWCRELGLLREQVRFERGFVREMTLGSQDDWDRALSCEDPLERLEIELFSDAPAQMGAFAALHRRLQQRPPQRLILRADAGHRSVAYLDGLLRSEALPHQLELALTGGDPDRLMSVLADGPAMERLSELTWRSEGLDALVLEEALRRVPALQHLHLAFPDPTSLAPLARALQTTGSLASLALEGGRDAEPLALWPALERLQSFSWRGRAPEPAVLARLPDTLRCLSLQSCLSTLRAAHLAAMERFTAVRELRLVDSGLDGRAFVRLAAAGLFSSTIHLDLSHHDLEMRALLLALLRPRSLSLAHTHVNDELLSVLGDALQEVRELNVAHTRIARLDRLAQLAPALRVLHLHGTEAVLRALRDSPLPERLQELHIHEVTFDERMGKLLAAIPFLRLRVLRISGYITAATRQGLAEAPWFCSLARAWLGPES